MMRRATALSYPVSIFIAGDPDKARATCRTFCDEEGLCVTVTPTSYVYTDGEEAGVIVGLINYPRFPKEPREIAFTAKTLALELMHKLKQQSVSVQLPDETLWFSIRSADLALAAAAREGGDVQQAPAESPQSGGATSAATPNPSPVSRR